MGSGVLAVLEFWRFRVLGSGNFRGVIMGLGVCGFSGFGVKWLRGSGEQGLRGLGFRV